MQGKGLAALLLCLALLAGCGGGGDANQQPPASRASGQLSSTSEPPSSPEEAQEQLKEATEKAIKERRAQAKAKDPNSQPPQIEHHDSGGGSAQFETKGGDNSIVEYGVEASEAEREQAATSLHAYLDSLAAHRWAAACTYLAAGTIALLERLPQLAEKHTDLKGCPEILGTLSSDTPQSTLDAGARADVASLRIEGDRAFLIYRGLGGDGYVMPMMREEGVWRVSSLAGTPAL